MFVSSLNEMLVILIALDSMIISTSMRSPFELSGESLGQHMALFNI